MPAAVLETTVGVTITVQNLREYMITSVLVRSPAVGDASGDLANGRYRR